MNPRKKLDMDNFLTPTNRSGRLKVDYARLEKLKLEPCPFCNAKSGEPCITSDKIEVQDSIHSSRIKKFP